MNVAMVAVPKPRSKLREAISLDGEWEIRFASGGKWSPVVVPGPWQASFPERAWRHGSATYRRSFARLASGPNDQIALWFGAVNYFARVRLNGVEIGRHEGGYLPFEFVLAADRLLEQNEIEVDVRLPTGDPGADPEFPFAEIPHGKQSWYGLTGGIWQSVRLLVRDARHIAHCAIAAAVSGTVRLEVECSDVATAAGAELLLTIIDPAGTTVARVSGPAGQPIEATVAAPKPWSPDAPNLYVAHLKLRVGGQVVDQSYENFGFRSIETRDGQFFLNGAPLYLRGALDQDYYPEGICTPPSLAFLEDQARKAKELGLNLLRIHIKVPDPRYYEVADRFGLLIWAEIPNVAIFTEKSSRRLLDTMSGILRRDGNHPSIIAWTIINEDWGTRLGENADQRAWLKDAYAWLKAKDPTRLVVDNSACFPNWHVQTDIDDYHYYRAAPELSQEWDALTDSFASRPDWTFSPHGDGVRRGDEPLVVSEFGVWGLPDPAKLRKGGKEPFWFENGADWGASEGVVYPHGIENRFRTYHLDGVFGTFEDFIDATQWHQLAALKYGIEAMRRHASIQGYVITEFTDVHWEANGLMDIERNPRVFHNRFGQINADLVILPRPKAQAVWSGDSLRVEIQLATGGSSVPAGAVLRCSVDGIRTKSLPVATIGPLKVEDIGAIDIKPRETSVWSMSTITFDLVHGETVLARNQISVPVYARRAATDLPAVHAADTELAAYLERLGYPVVAPERARMRVARLLGRADLDAIHRGARYVVLADGEASPFGNLRHDRPSPVHPLPLPNAVVPRRHTDVFQSEPGINVVERAGTIWRGDWVTGFSWVKRSGAFTRLAGGPLIDLSFSRVVPERVLTGFRSWEYDGLVHAGMVCGWVHKPAALIASRMVGEGRLVATTFRLLRDEPGADPVAASLLDAIIATSRENTVM